MAPSFKPSCCLTQKVLIPVGVTLARAIARASCCHRRTAPPTQSGGSGCAPIWRRPGAERPHSALRGAHRGHLPPDRLHSRGSDAARLAALSSVPVRVALKPCASWARSCFVGGAVAAGPNASAPSTCRPRSPRHRGACAPRHRGGRRDHRRRRWNWRSSCGGSTATCCAWRASWSVSRRWSIAGPSVSSSTRTTTGKRTSDPPRPRRSWVQ